VSSFELSPGVVVDTDRSEAYVMSPEGGIVALELGRGDEVWHSQHAAKPLAVSGDLLVSQAEAAGPENSLAIVALDRRERGTKVTSSVVELPSGVQPAINHSVNRSFTAQAQPSAADATVSWEFIERPLRGMAPGPAEVLPGEPAPPDDLGMPASAEMARAELQPRSDLVVMRGAVRVGLSDGTVTPAEAPHPESFAARSIAAPSAPASDVPAEQLLPDVPEPQFLSADGVHVLHSDRTADDTVWDKYLWTVFERSTGRRLGAVRSHVRFAPFFVNANRVVYQTEPYTRRIGTELVDEPVQIRAVDLDTGAPVWSRAIRDITDREPPPP